MIWRCCYRTKTFEVCSSRIYQSENKLSPLLNWPASSLHLCFVSTSLMMEKSQKVDGFIALLQSFHNVCCLQCEECCEWGYKQVCKILLLDVVAPEVHWTITLCQWTYFWFTAQKFSMVGGYTENPHTCQNWKVGTCTEMGACMGQYDSSVWLVMLIVLIIRTVGRLSQSKAVTFNWFMGPQNRFPCPNIPVSENYFAASKRTVVCEN